MPVDTNIPRVKYPDDPDAIFQDLVGQYGYNADFLPFIQSYEPYPGESTGSKRKRALVEALSNIAVGFVNRRQKKKNVEAVEKAKTQVEGEQILAVDEQIKRLRALGLNRTAATVETTRELATGQQISAEMKDLEDQRRSKIEKEEDKAAKMKEEEAKARAEQAPLEAAQQFDWRTMSHPYDKVAPLSKEGMPEGPMSVAPQFAEQTTELGKTAGGEMSVSPLEATQAFAGQGFGTESDFLSVLSGLQGQKKQEKETEKLVTKEQTKAEVQFAGLERDYQTYIQRYDDKKQQWQNRYNKWLEDTAFPIEGIPTPTEPKWEGGEKMTFDEYMDQPAKKLKYRRGIQYYRENVEPEEDTFQGQVKNPVDMSTFAPAGKTFSRQNEAPGMENAKWQGKRSPAVSTGQKTDEELKNWPEERWNELTQEEKNRLYQLLGQ